MKTLFLVKQIPSLLLLAFILFSSSAFAFSDLIGKGDSIENHIGKGKWTIVEVWTSGCHSCRQHMPSMVKFDGKLKNVRILGISLDSTDHIDKAKAFIADYDIKFPTLISNSIEMNIWMEANLGESLRGTPTFILFNEKGELSGAQAGIVTVEALEDFIMKKSMSSK